MPGHKTKISEDQTETFISNLINYPAIWDKDNKIYKNIDAKALQWRELSTQVGISKEDLEKVYKTHRKYYSQVSKYKL